MSGTYRGGDRQIRIRGVRRSQPDIRKLGAAILALAQARSEKAAEEEHKRRQAKGKRRSRGA